VANATRYRFRALGAGDAAEARALLGVFTAAFDEPETYPGRQPSEDYLKRLLGREHVIVLVAMCESGEVVGGILAYQLDKLDQDRREIYIYDLAVAEAHRRRGVATGLIAALRSIALDREAYEIFVQADLVDAPAVALYGKLGVKKTAHHFDIEVRRE
jgi:aminoglycoside 3-N-acetyltransferase I